jgi:hypothetical protein
MREYGNFPIFEKVQCFHCTEKAICILGTLRLEVNRAESETSSLARPALQYVAIGGTGGGSPVCYRLDGTITCMQIAECKGLLYIILGSSGGRLYWLSVDLSEMPANSANRGSKRKYNASKMGKPGDKTNESMDDGFFNEIALDVDPSSAESSPMCLGDSLAYGTVHNPIIALRFCSLLRSTDERNLSPQHVIVLTQAGCYISLESTESGTMSRLESPVAYITSPTTLASSASPFRLLAPLNTAHHPMDMWIVPLDTQLVPLTFWCKCWGLHIESFLGQCSPTHAAIVVVIGFSNGEIGGIPWSGDRTQPSLLSTSAYRLEAACLQVSFFRRPSAVGLLLADCSGSFIIHALVGGLQLRPLERDRTRDSGKVVLIHHHAEGLPCLAAALLGSHLLFLNTHGQLEGLWNVLDLNENESEHLPFTRGVTSFRRPLRHLPPVLGLAVMAKEDQWWLIPHPDWNGSLLTGLISEGDHLQLWELGDSSPGKSASSAGSLHDCGSRLERAGTDLLQLPPLMEQALHCHRQWDNALACLHGLLLGRRGWKLEWEIQRQAEASLRGPWILRLVLSNCSTLVQRTVGPGSWRVVVTMRQVLRDSGLEATLPQPEHVTVLTLKEGWNAATQQWTGQVAIKDLMGRWHPLLQGLRFTVELELAFAIEGAAGSPQAIATTLVQNQSLDLYDLSEAVEEHLPTQDAVIDASGANGFLQLTCPILRPPVDLVHDPMLADVRIHTGLSSCTLQVEGENASLLAIRNWVPPPLFRTMHGQLIRCRSQFMQPRREGMTFFLTVTLECSHMATLVAIRQCLLERLSKTLLITYLPRESSGKSAADRLSFLKAVEAMQQRQAAVQSQEEFLQQLSSNPRDMKRIREEKRAILMDALQAYQQWRNTTPVTIHVQAL